MAPADVMLITRHIGPAGHGRPGRGSCSAKPTSTSARCTLPASAPREDALMILALDDDVPEAVSEAIRAHEAVRDLWTIRLGSER